MANDTTTGRMFYPINVGKKDTDVTSDYDDKRNEFVSGDAFSDVSVNPQFKATKLNYENSTASSAFVNSANFIEIRNAPHSGGISNDNASRIVNRIYPDGTLLDTYAKNGDETNSFKIKVYDSETTPSGANSKFKYDTSDYPSSGVVGLDIDNYDYFILINPDLTGNKDSHNPSLVNTLDTEKHNQIRPHFAKITRITAFDEFGDGLEFEPKYPTAVPNQCNFEIYKGAAKTDTSVVAVSYGLRGDVDANTNKYDVTVRAIRPLFYFYNDRLDEDNQLDFCEKYNVTSERWWAYGTEINIITHSAHTQYANTSSEVFNIASADGQKLIEGQSIFDSNNKYIGNIKEKVSQTQFKIDYSREALSASSAGVITGINSPSPNSSTSFQAGTQTVSDSSNNGLDAASFTFAISQVLGTRVIQSISIASGGSGYSVGDSLLCVVNGVNVSFTVASINSASPKIKIGKTIQNVVFRTESKFSNTIPSLGRSRIHATLVDAHKTTDSDTSNTSFDATKWDSAFVKMKRHANDLLTPTANSIDGGLTGPNRYITFEKAEYKNNKIEPVRDSSLNSPKNKLTKMAHITTMDNSGVQHLKVREGDILKLRNNLFNGKFTKKKIGGYVNKTAASTLTLYDITTDIDLHHILSANDIVEVGDYHYVVNAVINKSADTQQSFTINDSKLKTANTWSGRFNLNAIGDTPAIEVLGQPLYVMPYSGVLNFEFESDTVAKITTAGVFQALTMNNVAVDKSDSRMHLSTMTPLKYNSHALEIDYADKNNKYAKLKDSSKTLYQKSTVSSHVPYYYNGSYSITDEVFSGEVEDIDIKTESGFTTFKISGRDDSSKLLGDTISKTLTQFSDVIKTSLPPLLTLSSVTNATDVTISGKTVTVVLSSQNPSPSDSFSKYSLLFNNTGDLIGEVVSATYDGGGGDNTWTIVLADQALTTTENNTIKTYNPYGSNQINLITGTKALQSNPADSIGFGDFTSISEKGMSFKSGLDIGYTSEFDYTTLQLSSNDSSTKSGQTLGYDISSPKSVSSDDSIFAFTIGDENGVDVTKSDIMSLNSEMFDIVEVTEQHSASTIIEIAPTFPAILGRVDSNSSDSRGNAKLYLVNSNIETGGFIHRLKDSFEVGGHVVPSETIRYWDLQETEEGGLIRTTDSIYRDGIRKQKIQGYAVGYGVKADGTTQSVTATRDNKPLAGSNTLKDWNHLTNFYGNYPLITSYSAHSDNTSNQSDIMYSNFEQIDPRTLPYEILVTGDIYPSSKIRHNSLFKHSKPFESFGIILEDSSSKTKNKTQHELYDGVTSQTLKRDINFETAVIKESSKNTAEMRRWGIIRLVEATFDWHFNPLDFESLKSPSEIPSLTYFDYVMISPPSILSGLTAHIGEDGQLTGTITQNNTLTVGDVVHKIDEIGTNPSENSPTLRVIGNTDGLALAFSNNTLSYNSTLGDDYGNLFLASPANNILLFDGHEINGVRINGVEMFRLFSSSDNTLDFLETTSDNEFLVDRNNGLRNINFHRGFLLHPPVDTGVFSHQTLKRTSSSTTQYDPMNVILPLMLENKSASSNKRDMRFSPAHNIDGWDDTDASDLADDEDIIRLHMSRVVSAMVDNSFGLNTPDITQDDAEALGIGRTHVYDNCIGLFREVRESSISTPVNAANEINWPTRATLTSSPMGFSAYGKSGSDKEYHDTNAEFTTYSNDYSSTTTKDQHTPTTRVYNFTNTERGTYSASDSMVSEGEETITSATYKVSLLGSKTKVYPFDKVANFSRNTVTTRSFNHHTPSSTTYKNMGKMYSSQFIVKPTFNLTGDTGVVVYSNDNKTITFTLNDDSTHTWLSFMPDLTGYYLVSEKLVDGDTLSKASHHGVPAYIGKITSHTISTAPSTSNYEAHQITLDTTLKDGALIGNAGEPTHGIKYRLMRISETTFQNTPEKIEFNVMNDSGLQYATVSTNFRKGSGDSKDTTNNKTFQEAVYSMYLKLDVDNAIVADNPFIESRTTASAVRGFTAGEVIDVFVSDGVNKQRKQMTVSLTRKRKLTNANEQCLVLTYEGDLTGNGVVSCGEVFDLTIGKKPKLQNAKKCYIGTTYDIGSNIDTELANIVKSAGLEYDETKSTSVFTTNIVNSNGTNTVVCLENVVDLDNGDVIYTEEGHLIGKILSINNQTITFASGGKYYSPPQYSAIIKYNKKTFVTNLTFSDTDLYGAINSLTNKKGLDYKIKGKKIIFRDSDDKTGLKMKQIKFEHLAGIEPIQNNTSLFDKVSKVIVNGDGVSHTMVSNKIRNMKTLTINDTTIKTQEEAMIEASKKLRLHSGEARKITLQINKEGFELLEAGDIVVLDFPTYNIPYGEYVIFEIENVLGMILTMTVGTYSKGIAERLSEITEASRTDTSHLLTADSIAATSGNALFDNLKLRVSSIEYKVVGETLNSNMGFDDVFGFSETVGFETTSTGISAIKKEYKNRFYD